MPLVAVCAPVATFGGNIAGVSAGIAPAAMSCRTHAGVDSCAPVTGCGDGELVALACVAAIRVDANRSWLIVAKDGEALPLDGNAVCAGCAGVAIICASNAANIGSVAAPLPLSVESAFCVCTAPTGGKTAELAATALAAKLATML